MSSKTSLIAAKTPESMEKFAQKILEKNSFKWGIYRQIWKIAVDSRTARNNPVGRPVGRPPNVRIFERWQHPVDSPVDPNKQRANCSQSVDRSVDRLQC